MDKQKFASDEAAQEMTDAQESAQPEEASENPVTEPSVAESAEEKAEEKRCPVCAALLEADAEFCTECGAAVKPKCKGCGATLEPGQMFCTGCGMQVIQQAPPADASAVSSGINEYNSKIGKKSKAKIIIPAIIVAVLLIFGAVGGYIAHVERIHQQVLEFTEDVMDYTAEVNSATVVLKNISEAWDIVDKSSYLYRSELRTYARNLYKDNISDAKDVNDGIVDKYNDIMSCDIEDPYVERIQDAVEKTHDLYLVIYEDVIENESGGNEDNADKVIEYIADVKAVVDEATLDYAS
ncbi:MAG: zinc ribbon domain-containing protein [Oscillospiraceae bacterium]|nr:zinc ribbon domain-containing protein [Oscillospiraceae bacterium]